MASCCDPSGYDRVFGSRFARGLARRYRRRGLGRTEQRIVDFCASRGIEGATVLEIGGGVGELQLELLSRGAAKATNLELVDSYDDQARDLAASAGVADRVHRRRVDIAVDPDEVEPADVVLLHRVVCCYPDYERLLSAAADHARRLLVFSHPPRNVVSKGFLGIENTWFRLTGNTFRTFAHPPQAMLDVAQAGGLDLTYRHAGPLWQIAGLERRQA
ncbi:MAG TPA: class I SAM-dependent methyltransferase [Nocardioidaceae bacterium]|nr:class I SAM-dependent methyltransferase [Nocardioidaceae bacterium]